MKDVLLVPVSSFTVISMITDPSPSNRAATPALLVHGFLLDFGSPASCFSLQEVLQPVPALPLMLLQTSLESFCPLSLPPFTSHHHSKQNLLLLAKAFQQKFRTLKCTWKLHATLGIQLFIRCAQITGGKQ